MNLNCSRAAAVKSLAMSHWQAMLRDDAALMAMPGAHHKALLKQAHALHQGQVIDGDDLSDLLEFADAALAFAVERLLDIDGSE